MAWSVAHPTYKSIYSVILCNNWKPILTTTKEFLSTFNNIYEESASAVFILSLTFPSPSLPPLLPSPSLPPLLLPSLFLRPSLIYVILTLQLDGAALIYTSARKDTNCDLLVDCIPLYLFYFIFFFPSSHPPSPPSPLPYPLPSSFFFYLKPDMEHRLFGFEMRQRAQMLEKDTIFIPFGWDSVSKIKLDFDNQKVCLECWTKE